MSTEQGANGGIHPRIARRRVAYLRDYLDALETARRARGRLGSTEEIDGLIAAARTELNNALQAAGERLDSRRRPRLIADRFDTGRAEYLLFLDECGDHALNRVDPAFPVFCLCGVIMERGYYQKFFEPSWRRLKAMYLGSDHVTIHEPELRKRRGYFEFRGDEPRWRAFEQALARRVRSTQATVIAGVIDKREYRERYGEGRADVFLPHSHYLVALDFLLERFLHFLHFAAGGAKGYVVAEARGAKDDVEVQYEYVRLQLEGTQYHPGSWFRHQLDMAVQFQTKDEKSCGLELADLLARPIAEKIITPASSPVRWDLAEMKLYDGAAGEKGKFGLKVFPSPWTGDSLTGLTQPPGGTEPGP